MKRMMIAVAVSLCTALLVPALAFADGQPADAGIASDSVPAGNVGSDVADAAAGDAEGAGDAVRPDGSGESGKDASDVAAAPDVAGEDSPSADSGPASGSGHGSDAADGATTQPAAAAARSGDQTAADAAETQAQPAAAEAGASEASEARTGLEGFVERLYRLVLQRDPDAGGFAWQVDAMRSGLAASQVSMNFFCSPEFGQAGHSNSEQVEIAYRTMLDRDGDAEGRALWQGYLDNGMSIASVVKGFSQAREFVSLCDSWGVACGTVEVTEARDRNPQVTAFATRLYSKVLDRGYDIDGLNFWCGNLLSGMGAGEAAQCFFNSVEFDGRALGSGEVVDIAYMTFLNREAEADGRAHWVSMLDDGMSSEAIVVGFGNSAEFRTLCGSWGVAPGSVVAVRGEARDVSHSVSAFVTRMYREVLNRAYDVPGLNNWCSQLLSGSGAYEIASGFFASEEFSARGLSALNTTECAYRTLLNREADLQGRSDWAHRILNGMSISTLVSGICASQEFAGFCSSSGVSAGNLRLYEDVFQYNGYGVTEYEAVVDGMCLTTDYVARAPYLFLGSSASVTSIALSFTTYFNTQEMYISSLQDGNYRLFRSGDAIDVLEEGLGQDANGAYVLYVKDFQADVQTARLCILKSSGTLSMYVLSDDPVNYGRGYVEGSADHSTKASATMILLDADGNARYGSATKGASITIKGRGNTTWREGDKKPYQIKLNKKSDLLATGEKSKTWILLANAADVTLLHNAIAYDLAAAMGLTCTPEYAFVDLFYDGDYRGSYMLCEKVEVGNGRVDIDDLDDANEQANSGIDIESQPIGRAYNKYGYEYSYVQGIVSPDDISGGYLLELDNNYGIGEVSWFKTSLGLTFSVRSPEYATREEMIYISELFEEAVQSIAGNGINAATSKKFEQYFDIDSFASLFLVKEISKDFDAFNTSTYFYKKAGDEKIYSGPMWDADTSFGIRAICGDTSYEGYAIVNGSVPALGYALLGNSSFMRAVSSAFDNCMAGLIKDLRGRSDGSGQMKSLATYVGEISATQKLNELRWGLTTFYFCMEPYPTYGENVSYLKTWLTNRAAWLGGQLSCV